MPETVLKVLKNEMTEEANNVVRIDINSVRPNPYHTIWNNRNPQLHELCESIRQHGIIRPVNVRPMLDGSYELISGEKRIKAASMIGLKDVPAVIVNISEHDAAIMAIVKGLQKEGLCFIKEAEAYNDLIKKYGLTQEELAAKLGKNQSTISNKLRILKLSPIVKKILLDNNLSERHSRALLKVKDEQLQLKVLKYICKKGLTVRKSEELINKVMERQCSSETYKDMENEKNHKCSSDMKNFANTIKNAVDVIKRTGIKAKAVQLKRGCYVDFIIRVQR